MAQITIRQVPDKIHRALKAQAKIDGVSAEAKARQLLAEGLFPAARPRLGEMLRSLARDVDPEGVDFSRDQSGIKGADFG